MKTNKQLRQQALDALSGNWTSLVLTTLLFAVLMCIINGSFTLCNMLSQVPWAQAMLSGSGSIVSLFLILPLSWAYSVLFLRFLRDGREVEVEELFVGFRDYLRVWGTMFLMVVYVLLWSLLLFLPGIVKSYSYAMTPYLLRDDPELSYNAAIDRSRELMRGHKAQLFWLDMSFLGWAILSMFTCGIGLLWLLPYMQTARCAFYEDLRQEGLPVDL